LLDGGPWLQHQALAGEITNVPHQTTVGMRLARAFVHKEAPVKSATAIVSIEEFSPPIDITPEVESCRPVLDQLVRENVGLRRALAASSQMRNLAYRDPLTELWNRHVFESRLLEELSRARYRPACCLSIVVVDVLGMTAINEIHGRDAGDRCLKGVACLLREAVREYDVVARLGGDEFAVLLPDTDARGATHVLARIRRLVTDANGRWGLPLGVSLGSATTPDGDTSGSSLLRCAEVSLQCDQERREGLI
jgi:diguanylate cyclase (GGDEF)-like protein